MRISDWSSDVCSSDLQQGVRLAIPGTASRVDLPLAVTIQDNGPGIPEDLQPHLFDPFVSTKAGGSGLGLALVAKIGGAHGGVIEFESQPRPTLFRLLLPVGHPDGKAGKENQTKRGHT